MTIERAIEIVLEEAERFEQNAQMLARDAQDPEGKCVKWANLYREKAQALRMIVEQEKTENVMRPLTASGDERKTYVRHLVGCEMEDVLVARRKRTGEVDRHFGIEGC